MIEPGATLAAVAGELVDLADYLAYVEDGMPNIADRLAAVMSWVDHEIQKRRPPAERGPDLFGPRVKQWPGMLAALSALGNVEGSFIEGEAVDPAPSERAEVGL